VAATRQNAGVALKTAKPPGPPMSGPPPKGGVNVPAATRTAEVILPSGSASDATLSHEDAAAGAATMIVLMAAIKMNRTQLLNIFLSPAENKKSITPH
jgi:hypothetical protein